MHIITIEMNARYTYLNEVPHPLASNSRSMTHFSTCIYRNQNKLGGATDLSQGPINQKTVLHTVNTFLLSSLYILVS
jgi:hypothetical protein